jgi:hypothetical protein
MKNQLTQAEVENLFTLEAFAFDLLNDLTDNHNATDEGGNLARRIQEARTPGELGGIVRYLQTQKLVAIQPAR